MIVAAHCVWPLLTWRVFCRDAGYQVLFYDSHDIVLGGVSSLYCVVKSLKSLLSAIHCFVYLYSHSIMLSSEPMTISHIYHHHYHLFIGCERSGAQLHLCMTLFTSPLFMLYMEHLGIHQAEKVVS